MDIQNIKRHSEEDRKSISMNIRISPKVRNWMLENNYSPTGIFYEAIKDLGFKQ